MKHDFSLLVDNKKQITLETISKCASNYIENQCDDVQQFPALKSICDELYHCMSKSTEIITMQTFFELIAEMLNGFFMKIHDRTLVCLTALVIVLIKF